MAREFFRRPLGLALAGGGALGAWQGAAMHALASRYGLVFDAVLGISAGALNGASYFLGRMEESLLRWGQADRGVLRAAPRLFPPSLCSNDVLWRSIAMAADEEKAKSAGRCRLVIVSAPTHRNRPVYAVYTPQGRDGWDAPLARHLVASCSIPFIFPPTPLSFRGEDMTLIDGAVRYREALSFAALGDCRDVIVLEMVRADEVGRKRGWFARVEQGARETCRGLMDQGVSSLKKLAEPPRVFRLAPSRALEFLMLDFKRSHLEDGLRRGAADARAFMENPRRGLV